MCHCLHIFTQSYPTNALIRRSLDIIFMNLRDSFVRITLIFFFFCGVEISHLFTMAPKQAIADFYIRGQAMIDTYRSVDGFALKQGCKTSNM